MTEVPFTNPFRPPLKLAESGPVNPDSLLREVTGRTFADRYREAIDDVRGDARLLSTGEAAESLGYSRAYFHSLLSTASAHYSPALRALGIRLTDQGGYVFDERDLRGWYAEHVKQIKENLIRGQETTRSKLRASRAARKAV